MRKKVPDYLLRMMDDYLSDRWVIYEGDKWCLKEEMTCGAPQGSRVGPLLWDVMYDLKNPYSACSTSSEVKTPTDFLSTVKPFCK